MPPRRSHKKSRAGCQRCKQRKIKCNEVHPVCGNCSKHGVSCDFEDPSCATSPVRLQRQDSENSLVRYSSPSTPASSTIIYQSPESSALSRYSASTRNLELRLLHNYTALTSKTLVAANTPATLETWQLTVPSMAFETPCLMNAVLAISALHMRAQNPNDYDLVRASHGYMASALSQYSSCLKSGVDASNAEALFTTSALIAFQASASRRVEDPYPDNGEGEGKYTLPIQWFHSFQGVKAVVLASWKWLRESDRVRPIIQMQPALELDLNREQPKFFDFLLDGLSEQLETLEPCRQWETRQAYEHAMAYLNWAHQKPERSRILGLPATVSRRFVELIEANDPRALVMISCFFAMTKVVDDVWWLQGVAKREVNGIMTLLPKEWWERMEWPLRVVEHDGVMDEETWGGCWHVEGLPRAEEGFNGDLRSHIDILAQLTPCLD